MLYFDYEDSIVDSESESNDNDELATNNRKTADS